MTRRIPILLISIAAACAHPPAPVVIAVPAPPERVAPGEPDADERAVYAALVEQGFAGRNDVVVADSTFPGEWPRLRESRLDSATVAGMEADFYRRNRTRIPFPADASANRPVRLYASHEVLVLPDGGRLYGGYAVFARRFPGVPGYHSVSRPGFDAARRHALVVTAYDCGSLCGDGGYVLLERGPDGWRIVSRTMTWVS